MSFLPNLYWGQGTWGSEEWNSINAASTPQVAAYSLEIVAQSPTLASPPSAGVFGVLDWVRRLIAMYPNNWTSAAAQTYGSAQPANNGLFGALFTMLGTGCAIVWQMAKYALAQTRLATATDVNLDIASIDFFGSMQGCALPRLVNQTDGAYSSRLRNEIVLRQPTLAGILREVLNYVSELAGVSVVPTQYLGLDVIGALDVGGALDITPQPTFGGAIISVFDSTSSPALAAQLGIVPGQFCILLSYATAVTYGFYLDDANGRAGYLDSNYLILPSYAIIATPNVGLDLVVRAVKATGYKVVYASNTAP